MHARAAAPLTALAGLTCATHAQGIGTVTLTASAATIGVGDIVTIGVVVDDNAQSPNGVVAFDIQVAGAGAAFTTLPGSLTPHPILFGYAGQLNPDGAQATGATPDFLGPVIDPPLNGFAVFTFSLTADEPGAITFTPADGPFSQEALVSINFGIVTLPTNYDLIIFEGVTITVIPTPPGLVPLALAFPLAARRRR